MSIKIKNIKLKKRKNLEYSFIEFDECCDFNLKEIGYSKSDNYELYLDDENFIFDFHKHLEGISFWT
jgi:hypothetical protein